MIITAITIENFKAIREPILVEIKPITLLFGPNSSGKSSIVQAIHYVREILERNNADADLTMCGGRFVDLGGFRNVVHMKDLSREIRIRFDLDLQSTDLPTYHDPAIDGLIKGAYIPVVDLSEYIYSAAVELIIAWSDSFEKPYVREYRTFINEEPFACLSATPDEKRTELSELNFLHSLPLFNSINENFGNGKANPHLLDLYNYVTGNNYAPEENRVSLFIYDLKYAVPNWGNDLDFGQNKSIPKSGVKRFKGDGLEDLQLFAILSQLVVGPGELLRNELMGFRYLGPIREIPPRCYEAPKYPDMSRWANGLAAWDTLSSADNAMVNQISYWMNERLNTGYVVAKRRYREIEDTSRLHNLFMSERFFDKDEDTLRRMYEDIPEKCQIVLKINGKFDVMPQDVGIGISQVLPVIVAALSGKSLLVAIEQPELHIHPRLQAELGDLFLQAALSDVNNSFIIETHSEHLLLRIMRRIRESQQQKSGVPSLSPEMVGICYVELIDNKTVAREMPLNKRGELVKAWPGGFFEEGLREVF